jgi:hypothetical protein
MNPPIMTLAPWGIMSTASSTVTLFIAAACSERTLCGGSVVLSRGLTPSLSRRGSSDPKARRGASSLHDNRHAKLAGSPTIADRDFGAVLPIANAGTDRV